MPYHRKPKPEDFREQFESLIKGGEAFSKIAKHFGVGSWALRRWLSEEYPGLLDAQAIRYFLGIKRRNGHRSGGGKLGRHTPQSQPSVIPKDQLRPIEEFLRPTLAVPVRYMTEEEFKRM